VEPAFEIKEGQIERKKKLGGQLKKKKLRIKFYFIFYFYEIFYFIFGKNLEPWGSLIFMALLMDLLILHRQPSQLKLKVLPLPPKTQLGYNGICVINLY
jgi:hypothetical protein